jgi:mannose-1-phosphate guanylyltransferase
MKTVLLASGFGSRLWPLSISEKPKQFQPILKDRSLLQYTYELFKTFTPKDDLYVMTKRSLTHWIHQQLPDIQQSHILTVPDRRNTLPHTLFALSCLTKESDEQIFFSGTDLLVTEPKAFGASIRQLSKKHTDPKKIVMMLSNDGAPDPGAGYAVLDSTNGVTKFYEKPDLKTISELSRSGSFYKNTFAFYISRLALEEVWPNVDPSLANAARKLLAANNANRDEALLAMPICDISTAAFLHAPNIVGHTTDSDFVDLGKFSALYQVNHKDKQGNVVIGKALLEPDCKNNLVVNLTDEPLVVIALQSSVIVQTQHGSLVSPMDQADRIGEIYKQKIHAGP